MNMRKMLRYATLALTFFLHISANAAGNGTPYFASVKVDAITVTGLIGYVTCNAASVCTASSTVPFGSLSGTISAAQLIPPAGGSALGAAKSSSAPTNQFATGLNTNGELTYAQPAFSDLSGSASAAQLPAFIGGDCTTSAGSVALNCTKTNGNLLVSVLTPKVDNNTALSALASTYATAVVRLGFAAAGDAPPVTYTPSNSACTLNAGAGDGGSQIPSSDGKCWIANFNGRAWVSQFGAKGDNSTDDTAALNAASLAISLTGGVVGFDANKTFKISNVITLRSNVEYAGAIGTSVSQSDATKSIFYGTSVVKAKIHDLKLNFAAYYSGDSVQAIYCSSCSYLEIQRNEITGTSWDAIRLYSTSYSYVAFNYIHGHLSSASPAPNGFNADIALHANSLYNVVEYNTLEGDGVAWIGIDVQSWAVGSNPQYNLIHKNKINNYAAYGINDYASVDNAINYNQITHNTITNIQGGWTYGTIMTGNAGACIYVQGTAGGVVSDNIIDTCNVQTSASTLTPAAIGASGQGYSLQTQRLVIARNRITNVNKWYCIEIASSLSGAIIENNFCKQNPSSTAGVPLVYINNSSNVTTRSNHLSVAGTGNSALLASNSSNPMSNFSMVGDYIDGGDVNPSVVIVGGGVQPLTDVYISALHIAGGTSSSVPFELINVTGGKVRDNVFNSNNSFAAAFQQASTNVIWSGNTFYNSVGGGWGYRNSGDNTGTRLDETNIHSAFANKPNATTAGILETVAVANAVPASPPPFISGSNLSPGDRVRISNPSAGNPKAWVIDTAGNARSEGNL